MRKFRYYSNNNKKKETCGVVLAENKKEAIKFASSRKRLKADIFLLLFSIDEVQDGKFI